MSVSSQTGAAVPAPAAKSESQSTMLGVSLRKALFNALGFVVLFLIAMVITRIIPAETAKSYPNPLWVPVVFLSLQLGLWAGILAAAIAVAVFVWQGLPPATWTEDIYQYFGRVSVEPLAWTFMALVVGYLRRYQIRERAELKAELAERNALTQTIAQRCEELRQRSDMLERHIAATVATSHVDLCEAACSLHDATLNDFAERLRSFVSALMGTPEFALYVLHGNELKAEIVSADEYQDAAHVVVSQGQPLFGAIVQSKRLLVATRPIDQALLDQHDTIIGPIFDRNMPQQVVGMLRIGGFGQSEFPEHLERKFALAQKEVTAVLERLSKADHPEATSVLGVTSARNWMPSRSPQQKRGQKGMNLSA